MELFIVTGSSRGLGEALSLQLLEQNHEVLGIARHKSDRLENEKFHFCAQWQRDLSDAVPVARELESCLSAKEASQFGAVTLINNAGMLGDITPLVEANYLNIATTIRVGLEAAMVLSGAFLRATRLWGVPRKIMNISSGLARYPSESLSSYCAAKAGIDHFSRVLALEEATHKNGAKICAIAPGVVESQMQERLRSADERHFPRQPFFQDLFENKALATCESTAQALLNYLKSDAFGSEVIADVRKI